MPQALVILSESHAEAALSSVCQRVKISQRLPPRIAVVEGPLAELDALRGVVGVMAVSEAPLPAAMLEGLAPTERLFAEAWSAGRKPKASRPGDGLSWDAEGFQPPDLPTKK